MNKQTQAARKIIADVLATVSDYQTAVSRLSEKDRQTFQRQIEMHETKFDRAVGARWKRLGHVMMSLSAPPAKLTSNHSIQFYVPDGQYRKQVYALHSSGDGTIEVYAPNVLDQVVKAGLLARVAQPDGDAFRAGSGELLAIEQLDGKSPNPEFYCKAMTGWNRKAICMRLPLHASEAQTQMAEELCALAATDWLGAARGRPVVSLSVVSCSLSVVGSVVRWSVDPPPDFEARRGSRN